MPAPTHRTVARLSATSMRRRRFVQSGFVTAAGAFLTALEGAEDAFARGKAQREAAQAEQEGSAEESVSAEAEAEAEEEPEPDPELALYRLGDSGEEVGEIQRRLAESGYWLGEADGGFGHLTQQAVFALQKAHGLSRDGIVGPDVRAALNANTRPTAVAGGDHVEVHLSSQLLLVVRTGVTSTVLNTSTANGEQYEFKGRTYTARTRTGDFSVWLQHPQGWKDGELGEMWRPMFYSGNYAIHGSRSIPAVPASHGCARVSVAAMDMIWADQVMTIGTRVLVV
ncbi:MAG: L,D-transpeptidase family protein [Ornithinimicrobium sp.]